MAAKGQIEIRIKFSGIPLADPETRGYNQIEIKSEGYVVLAKVKAKTYERFLATARKLKDWEGLLSGKLLHIQGHQLFVANAGLQCYAKKEKVANSTVEDDDLNWNANNWKSRWGSEDWRADFY